MTTRSLLLAVLGTIGIGVILVFFISLLMKRRRKPPYRTEVHVQTGVEVETGRLAIPSGPFDRRMNVYPDEKAASQVPANPVWRLGLTDQATGKIFQGQFSDSLYLGREQAEPQDHVLFVASDSAVSRLQCILVSNGDEVFVEHCGQSNPTRLNGTVLSAAEPLSVGDMLSFAGVQLKVTTLRRA